MQVAQRSFAAGEITPSLWARTDLAKYQVGLRTCRNFIVQRQGGAANRPGTEYVAPLNSATRLLPFVYNDAQAYVLAFTDRSLTIVRAGGVVVAGIATPYFPADLPGLQIAQSADVVTIVHPNYPPAELKRLADAVWTYTAISFKPTIAAPTNLAALPVTPAPVNVRWVVTAVSAKTGEESYASSDVVGSSAAAPVQKTVSWDPVPGASAYRVYRGPWVSIALVQQAVGFIAEVAAPATTFFDAGTILADMFAQPPAPRPLFEAAGDYPSAVSRHQQRLLFGGTTNAPETVWTSRVGDEHNFTVSRPLQDDDAVTFTPASKKVNLVRHLVDVSPMLLLTSGGAAVVGGDGAGILRPTDINVQQLSVPGAGSLPPITAEGRVLYVHARQSTVRAIDLHSYAGLDLTLMAAHLFAGKTLVDWTYQETPHSVLWAVRADGVLLGCTMLPSEDVLAWHRHDTDGAIEAVCAIPEGSEDRLYLVVNRAGRRSLERMASRFVTDMRDAIFVDNALSYDGRNTSGETMTLTGGPRWTPGEAVTVTRSGNALGGGFLETEIGNAIFITDAAGVEVRITLRDYVSPTVMRGLPSITVPTTLRNVARTTWSRAVDDLSGLGHLEGKAVAVVADGTVAANPLNPAAGAPTVVLGGKITLDRPYAVIRVGLPYIADLETLDIDSPSGRAVKEPKTLVQGATVHVESSRGFWAGQTLPPDATPLAGLDEALVREQSDGYDPIVPRTGPIPVGFAADWQSSGRMAIRHVDPIPLTVSAIVTRGLFAP